MMSRKTKRKVTKTINAGDDGIGCFGIFGPTSSSSSSSSSRKVFKSKSKSKMRYPLFQPVAPKTKRHKGSSTNTHNISIVTSHNNKIAKDISCSMSLQEIDSIIQRKKQKDVSNENPNVKQAKSSEKDSSVSRSRKNQKPHTQQTAINSFFMRRSQSITSSDSSSSIIFSSDSNTNQDQDGNTHINEKEEERKKPSEMRQIEEKKEEEKIPTQNQRQISDTKKRSVFAGAAKSSRSEESCQQGPENIIQNESEEGVIQFRALAKETEEHSSLLSKHPRNILSLLEQRKTCVSKRRRYSDSGYHEMRNFVHQNWKVCESVELNSNINQSEITHMEYDSEGVLLACGDTRGIVRIFDFDEVNSAVIREEKCSRTTDTGTHQKTKINPFITFHAGNSRISCIRWNPSNEDLLVVSFFNHNEVRVFDISSSSGNRPLYLSLVDVNDRRHSRANGCTALHFIPSKSVNKSRILIGGASGSLKLWEIPTFNIGRGNQKHGTLVWSMNPLNEKITEILHLYSNGDKKEFHGLVMVGTAVGSFAVFDIQKCACKSFSSSKTPQQLKMWNLSRQHRGLQNHILPNKNWMGIKKCVIFANKSSLDRNSLNLRKSVDLTVCLNSGWIITMQLDFRMRNNSWQVIGPSFKVIHKPPSITFQDSEGNEIDKKNPPVCVPEFSTPAACLGRKSSLIMIADVRPIRTTLQSTDKRVLGTSNEALLSRQGESDKIAIIDQKKNARFADDCGISKISLPRGKLKHMVIHPDSEWVVLSVANSTNTITNPLRLVNLQL